MPFTKKLAAELIGTWMLVVVGPGAAAVTLMLADGSTGASAFSIGIGTLGGLGDWCAIALAFACVLVAGIYLCGPVSGAHFNPAVTVGLWATKRFPAKEVLPYILAQCLGAILGSLTLLAMLGADGSHIGGLGAPGVFPGITVAGAFIAELVGTFILMLAIMGIAVDKRAPSGWAGLVIGLTVAGVIITMGNISGQGINPARSLGPILVNAIMGNTGGLTTLWLFIIAPLIGGVLAALVYDWFIADKGAEQAAAEADAA